MRTFVVSRQNRHLALIFGAWTLALLVLSLCVQATGPVAGLSRGSGPSASSPGGRAGDEAAAPLDGIPQISGVAFKFQKQNGVVLVCKLTLTGANYQSGCVVQINGQQAPKTLFTSGSQVLAKGGAKLAKMLPKHTSVNLTVVNPDGQTSNPYPFTRP